MDARPLWYFMNERERIRQKKESGQRTPWTSDQILADYRFCNVFRRHDRVTRWLLHNWYEPYKDHPNLWFACAVARQINWPETLAAIGFPTEWNPARVKQVMEERQNSGKKVFTGAYIIAAGPAGIPKAGWVVYNVLDKIYRNAAHLRPRSGDTLEAAHARLKQYDGFGEFLAFEVVLDWLETPLLSGAADRSSFAAAGPGAIRGLNRLYGRPLGARISPNQALAEMRELLALSEEKLGPHVQRPLDLADIEGGLCETDKYLRIQQDGRAREKYTPSKDPLPGIL